MEIMRRSTPRVLMRNKRYSTYQLSAWATSTKETPENQFVISVLTVLEWLRTKFRDFDIPPAFQVPGPEEYKQVPVSDLKSAHIEAGYSVETICFSREQIWALRLIEPDLSTRWESGKEISTAVPGRIFETNIAFRVVGAVLHCGINIVVSEPENIGPELQAIGLRPAVVPVLAANPKLRLSAGYPFDHEVWELNTKEKHKKLRDYLKNRVLPAAIFCDRTDHPICDSEVITPKELVVRNSPNRTHPLKTLKHTPPRPNPARPCPPSIVRPNEEQGTAVPYDIELFARSRTAYVYTFHLPASQFDVFKNVLHISPNSGDVLFIPPQGWGEDYRCYPYSDAQKKQTFDTLMKLSQNYMRGKVIVFKNVAFLTEAKALLAEHHDKADLSANELQRQYEDQIAGLCDDHERTVMRKNAEILRRDEKITRLKDQLADLNAQIKAVQQASDDQVKAAQGKVEAIRDRLEYLESLSKRPRMPRDVPQWVKKRFSDRLEFHPKAVKLIQGVTLDEIDMPLLCDALEYLAMEYRDLKTGDITWERATSRCAEKYGRPFEISGSGETSISMYPSQYKVKYKKEGSGKAVETPLDEHLKVGNTNGNLIRIYFFFDDEQKKIVIGSLPHHLKVSQIKA